MDGTAIILALVALVGTITGAIGAFVAQWYQARKNAPKVTAEAAKAQAEADRTAAETWRSLYEAVSARVTALEGQCEGLKALVRDVEFLKRENRRLKTKVNQVISYYSQLYHEALSAGLDPAHEPPDPEEIEEC
jgi:uncharacterized protein HemX